MRIIQLSVENVKKIKAVAIKPDGSVIRITGKNGHGKSSLLDAIYWAFAGKRATSSRPVRDTEETAVIKLDLGDIRITRKFTRDGGTTLIVESVEGARFPSPQAMLDKLFGELSFDPLAFSRAEGKKQLETLKGLVRLDVDLDALDGLNQRDFEERTEWNRKVRSLDEREKTLRGGVVPDMDVEPIDQGALIEEIEEAVRHNADIHREKDLRSSQSARQFDLGSQIQGTQQEIDRLLHKKKLLEEQLASVVAQRAAWPELPEPIDVHPLRVRAAEADKENQARTGQRLQRERHQHAVDDLQVAKIHAEQLTKQIEERTAAKQAAIGGATMPVPGLSFGHGEVLYNDLPFDQASTAEQIRVSMGIAMALNPKLRVVLIRDGSLLDEASLAVIEQMAEEHDFQIFLESVANGSSVGILLEEGRVVSIDGVAVEDPQVEAVAAD